MELYRDIAIVDLPNKGVGVVALECIAKGDIIARWFPHDTRTIERVVESLDAFEQELAANDSANERNRLLNHSWPTSEGRIVVGAKDAVFGSINHSSPPTVMHTFGASVWTTTACTTLNVGDELCYDYNLGSKYEIRKDCSMRDFLSLCDRYGVQKRPSQGMATPPCRLSENDLLQAKPLKSSMPPRKNNVTECTIWI